MSKQSSAEKRDALLSALDNTLANSQVFSANMAGLAKQTRLRPFAALYQHLGMMANGSGWFAETLTTKIRDIGGFPLSYQVNKFRADIPAEDPIDEFDATVKRATHYNALLLKSVKALEEACDSEEDELKQLSERAAQIIAGNIWLLQSMRQAQSN